MAAQNDILAKLKLVYNGSDRSEDDVVLQFYLDQAKDSIMSKLYPFNPEKKELPKQYEDRQLKIAIYLLNKRGAEGQLAHGEMGISRTYESADVPASMLKGIIPYGKVV